MFLMQILFFRSQPMWLSKCSFALFVFSSNNITGTQLKEVADLARFFLCAISCMIISSDLKQHVFFLLCRPAFLPDPNDGSLYSLGGKNNEGLTVSKQRERTDKNIKLPFSEESSNRLLQQGTFKSRGFWEVLGCL